MYISEQCSSWQCTSVNSAAVSRTSVNSAAVKRTGGVYVTVSSTAVSSAIRSAGGSLHVALREVTWCMVVWCTQELRRDSCSFMWHQPCQRCKYTTSVDIKKRAIKLVTHVEPQASAVSLLKRAENSAI